MQRMTFAVAGIVWGACRGEEGEGSRPAYFARRRRSRSIGGSGRARLLGGKG